MKKNDMRSIGFEGLLADEISAIAEYVADGKSCGSMEYAELHNAIFEMHDNFPKWLEHRAVFLDQATVSHIIKQGSKL